MKNSQLHHKAIIIFLMFNITSVVLYSCCEDIYRVIPDQIETGFSLFIGDDMVVSTDTITGPFSYGLSAEVEFIGDAGIGGFMINKAYAFQCAEEYENSFVRSTAKVILNKSVTIDGATFASGENLLDLEEEYGGDGFYAYVGPGHIQLRFREPFLSRCEFEEGTYEFHTFVETANGDVITAVDTVYIAL